MTTPFVTGLEAPIFIPFWEKNALPGGWVKKPVKEVLYGPIEEIIISTSGSSVSVLGDVYNNVTFTGWSNGSTVDVSGFVWGDVIFKPLSDGNSFSADWVFGGININDAWYTTLNVDSVYGGISVNDVFGGNYDIGWTPTYQVEGSFGVEAELGVVYDVNFYDVDQSETNIGTLLGNMMISGEGNDVAIGNAYGATIQIASDATNTSIQIEQGGVVFDNGDSTQFVGGEGDQFVFANGDGVSMYNGGGLGLLGEILGIQDNDTFVDNGGGIDIIAGFESVTVDTHGDVIILDPQNVQEATLQLGDHNIDLDAMMNVFGHQEGNDAVIDFNEGSVTLVGAGQDYFDSAPVDDLLFM